jgi:hypothetical protein
MSKQRNGGGPNLGLLLLIPSVVIIAKAARHRRAMWESGWGGPSGPAGHPHGQFTSFGTGQGTNDERGTFRLPPKIEWLLDSWHTRAHQQQEAAETTTV